MPKGALRIRVEPKVPEGEAVSRVEAPRGELLHYGLSDGTNKPRRWRIRTPTYANIPSWKPMFVGGTIAEIPIVLASIDPCFSCTDRVTIVDANTGKSRSLTKDELKRWRG
jgi:Ni,Fe-hydrogenase III large subunit